MILSHAGHVDQLTPPAQGLVKVPCPARHGVGVHIDGVDRVAHGHHVVHAENVPNIAAVALGSVGDKDFAGADGYAAGLVVVLGDCATQELIPLLGPIAVEVLGGGHLVHGGVHGGGDGGGKGPGHIPNAQADEAALRVLRRVGGHAAGNLRKEIAAR